VVCYYTKIKQMTVSGYNNSNCCYLAVDAVGTGTLSMTLHAWVGVEFLCTAQQREARVAGTGGCLNETSLQFANHSNDLTNF
jgi:hypothetical protein